MAAHETAPGARSAYLDNARALLIVLVVFGHLIQSNLGANPLYFTLYPLVYAFHMPAFALVSGYLSKADGWTRAGLAKIGRLALIYVLFQTIYVVATVVLEGTEFSLEKALVEPVKVMWWIVSLICWRLMLPAFSLGRSKAAAVFWVGLALVMGLASGWFLPFGVAFSLSRTFVFFPFFLAGFWANRAAISVRHDVVTRALAVVAFVAATALIVWIRANVPDIDGIRLWTILWAREPYLRMGFVEAPWLARLGNYALSAVLVAAFLQLVPKSRSPLSALGAATLSIFLWHQLAIMLMFRAGLTSLFLPSVILTALVAVGLSVVLGVGPIAEWTERLLRGKSPRRG